MLMLVQAVHMLHEEVGSLSEGSCGDMLVLPIYAALPPELQARSIALLPLICNSSHSAVQLHSGCGNGTLMRNIVLQVFAVL